MRTDQSVLQKGGAFYIFFHPSYWKLCPLGAVRKDQWLFDISAIAPHRLAIGHRPASPFAPPLCTQDGGAQWSRGRAWGLPGLTPRPSLPLGASRREREDRGRAGTEAPAWLDREPAPSLRRPHPAPARPFLIPSHPSRSRPGLIGCPALSAAPTFQSRGIPSSAGSLSL